MGNPFEELERFLKQRRDLIEEVRRLESQRQDLARFLDIDAERTEVTRLKEEKAGILAGAEAERDRLLATAQREAHEIVRKGTEVAEQIADGIIVEAKADAGRMRDEATALVLAGQTDAQRIVSAAQAQARQLMREAEGIKVRATADLEGANAAARQLTARETSVTERERAVAKAGADFQRRVDEFRASMPTIR